MTIVPPPVPENGVTVRDGDDGFVARIWPAPPVNWRMAGAGAVAFGALAAAGAASVDDHGTLRLQVALSVLLFGTLLIGVHHASGYMPREIGVERGSLSWNGERIPWTRVADAQVEGLTLTVVDDHGAPLAQLYGARPEVAKWLAEELQAAIEEVRGEGDDA